MENYYDLDQLDLDLDIEADTSRIMTFNQLFQYILSLDLISKEGLNALCYKDNEINIDFSALQRLLKVVNKGVLSGLPEDLKNLNIDDDQFPYELVKYQNYIKDNQHEHLIFELYNL